MRIVGVLLAAGRGERFGGDKLLAPLGGSTIGATSSRNLLAALDDVIAIVRPGDARLITALRETGVRVIECATSSAGMGASLACGVRASADADGWIVALADMPWIEVATIAKVAEAIERGASVAAPFHDAMRGHPVGFGKNCASELAALEGDDGAKSVVAAHRDAIVRIDVSDPGILRDIDTPNDLV